MKDKILAILEKHATPFLENRAVHESNWGAVAEDIMYDVIGFKKEKMFDDFVAEGNKQDPKKLAEKDFLEMFNRIRCAIFAKKNKKCIPVRKIAKPAQLHTALKTYSMDEIGKVVYNVYSDRFHHDNNYKFSTTEYCTRQTTIDKFLQ